jgi:hypothetical protein
MKVNIELFISRFIFFFLEIHQQILVDQSAQNVTNNNETDSGIQRSRSSITRTLLMNSGK